MPFLSPNQQCLNTLKGKISHSMDLLTSSSTGGLPTLSLTTNSSWLPCGRVAMPLISPLMPVPQTFYMQLNIINELPFAANKMLPDSWSAICRPSSSKTCDTTASLQHIRYMSVHNSTSL